MHSNPGHVSALGGNLMLFSNYKYTEYVAGASKVPCPEEVTVTGLGGSAAEGWGEPSRGAGRKGEASPAVTWCHTACRKARSHLDGFAEH